MLKQRTATELRTAPKDVAVDGKAYTSMEGASFLDTMHLITEPFTERDRKDRTREIDNTGVIKKHIVGSGMLASHLEPRASVHVSELITDDLEAQLSSLMSENGEKVVFKAAARLASLRGVPTEMMLQSISEFDAAATAVTSREPTAFKPKRSETLLPASPPPLTDAELDLLKAHVATHPWKGRASRMNAVTFLTKNYETWLKRGLPLEVLRPLQDKLAGAYSVAISRDPSKAVKGLYVAPHRASPDAPLPTSRKRISELSDEEATSRHIKDAASSALYRFKKKTSPTPL